MGCGAGACGPCSFGLGRPTSLTRSSGGAPPEHGELPRSLQGSGRGARLRRRSAQQRGQYRRGHTPAGRLTGQRPGSRPSSPGPYRPCAAVVDPSGRDFREEQDMVIGVRGMVASAATAVVVGLGALAAPNALAAPASLEEAPVEAGSPVVTGWAPAGRAGHSPRRRHRDRGRGRVHRQLRVHPGRSGVPRAGGALRRHRGGHGDRRLQLRHRPAGHRGDDPRLRRARPHRRDGLQLVGGDAGGRRDRPRRLRLQRLRARRAELGRRRGRQPEHAVLRRPDRPARGHPAGRVGGARVRQLDDRGSASRHCAPRPARWCRARPGASATRCTRSAPASPATRAAAT